MKHAILGAGAIGGLMGTALSSLGEEVTLIVRHDHLAAHPSTVTLERPSGVITASVKVASRLIDSADLLWIATKTYQLHDALAAVENVPRGIVPLLNGIDHVAVLRQRFGHDRVIPATIAVEAERTALGRYLHRTPVRLSVAAGGQPLLKGILEGLSALGFSCQFIAGEPTLLWSKMCFLEPFALATSASGMNLGQILADPEWKQKLESATREACAVAVKDGAHVDAEKFVAIFSAWAPTVRASMAKDLAAGRPLELDGIAGPVLRGGVRYDVSTPTTARLVAAIEKTLQDRRP